MWCPTFQQTHKTNIEEKIKFQVKEMMKYENSNLGL